MIKTALPLLFAAVLAASTSSVTASEEKDLINLMAKFQYFMHKTALSLDAKNLELVDFYAHEIKENLEATEDYGNYDGFSIGQMVKQTLTPEFEKFEEYVDANDLNAANQQFNKVTEACNSCHRSTKKGFIRMERLTINPYLQSFTP